MDTLPLLVLLLHPLLASGLVVWVWWQYAWRKKSYELKGEERANHLKKHETNGERLLWATGGVILVAFVARGFVGYYEGGDVMRALVPQSLHGFMGPVGFGLMVALTRFGKQARSQRLAGESFATSKLKHGRSADLVIYLVFIHAFLGFIYTFDVLA
jgi:fatty acid desaturase